VASLAGANMAIVVTNLLLIEQIFDVPGVFRLTTNAMANGDFPLLQGMVVAAAVLIVAGNLLADVAIAWLDPRVRLYGVASG
jgi:peptide/nickel transport system permease protein